MKEHKSYQFRIDEQPPILLKLTVKEVDLIEDGLMMLGGAFSLSQESDYLHDLIQHIIKKMEDAPRTKRMDGKPHTK